MTIMEKSGWSKLPLSVQSFSLEEFDIDDVISHARELGFSRIELFNKHLSPRSTPSQITHVKKLLNAAGISISAYGLFTFTRNREHNKSVFDFATLAGIRNIVGEVEDGVLDSVATLAEEYNVRVCIHTSGPNSRYEKLEQLVADVKNQPKNIGVCIDTGHILRSGGSPEEWITALSGRVFAVHLTDVAEKSRLTHSVVVGTGHLNLRKMLDALLNGRFPSDGSIAVGFQANACARLTMPPGDLPDALGPLAEIAEILNKGLPGIQG